MSQTATKLVKDTIENAVREAESESQGSVDHREVGESRQITQDELEAAVREGVQEGLREYQKAAEQGEVVRGGGHEYAESDATDEESSSSGGGLGRLVLLGLVVAVVLYLRRRAKGSEYATDY